MLSGTCVIGDEVIEGKGSVTCPDECNHCGCEANEDGSYWSWTTFMACTFSQPPLECKELA